MLHDLLTPRHLTIVPLIMAVSEQTLLEGAWFALEQAARLLRGAVVLLDAGHASTGVAIAMFGREELGRSRILRDCATEIRGGAVVETQQVTARCDDHVAKQAASAFSVFLRSNTTQRQPSPEALRDVFHRKARRQPGDRHAARMSALYVDLKADGVDWDLPLNIDVEAATQAIVEALNDYSLERDHLLMPEAFQPQSDVAEMQRARAAMTRQPGQPGLPALPWPANLGG